MQHFDIIIIGNWISGLLVASEIERMSDKIKICIIGAKEVSQSQLSWGEICTRWLRQKSLKRTILDAGESLCNLSLLKLYLKNLDEWMTKISDLCTHKPSYLGIKIAPWELMNAIKKSLKNTQFIEGVVQSVCKQWKIFSYLTFKGESELWKIMWNKLLLCTGGYSTIFDKHDNVESKIPIQTLQMLYEMGIIFEDLDLIMVHPFTKINIHKKIHRACIATDTLAWSSISTIDGKKCERTEYFLKSHNAHQNFSEILTETGYNDIVTSQGILWPAAHYTIGWIQVNTDFQTSVHNIFAFWECMRWLSWRYRVGWVSFSEIISLAASCSKSILQQKVQNNIEGVVSTYSMKKMDSQKIPLVDFFSEDKDVLRDIASHYRKDSLMQHIVQSRIHRVVLPHLQNIIIQKKLKHSPSQQELP